MPPEQLFRWAEQWKLSVPRRKSLEEDKAKRIWLLEQIALKRAMGEMTSPDRSLRKDGGKTQTPRAKRVPGNGQAGGGGGSAAAAHHP